MIKEIKYNGLTTTPPDNLCPDGDAAFLLNIVPEDGALKPVLPPKTVMELQANMRIVYIHKSSAYKNYIIHDTERNKLVWTSNGKEFTDLYDLDTKELHKVIGVGNTLIALTSIGMLYFLWKSDTSGYHLLGNDIPELSLSFGLQGEMKRTDKFTINFANLASYWHDDKRLKHYHEFSAENKKKVSSQVLAKVNKFIADESTNKGRFLYPFLLRYAYRLYDGSLTRHSAPILMVCSTSCAPIVTCNFIYPVGELAETANLRVIGMLHQLDYAVINESELNLLKNWSDIVKSVDIFISKPIYTYDQNGECDKIYCEQEYENEDLGYSVCKHINQIFDTAKFPVRYQMKNMNELFYNSFFEFKINRSLDYIIGIPIRDTSIIKEEIRNCSNFYFLKSIKVEQLTTTRTIIDIKEDYLQSLVTREVMTDDYDSHDNLIPKNALVYNSRVNLTNVRKRLFEGFNAVSMLPFTDGNVKIINIYRPSTTEFDKKIVLSVYIYIRQGGKEIVVHGKAGVLGYGSPIFFIYYPNVNAYKAVLECYDYNDDSRIFYEIPLERHAFLNGSFYFGGFRKIIKDGVPLCFAEWGKISGRVSPTPTVSNDNERTIDISNKIYTSEINNPLYYPLLGINTVGTGKILGISTAAKALSEGQFGQFPLYAFTTEGVWALEVSKTGTYTARQPITRDVCLDAKSLTQIDSAVLFATNRGIMMIQGSQSTCISNILNGDNAVSVLNLPKIDKILEFAGQNKGSLQILPFMEFVQDCRMIYDYKHQRIIVYNNSKDTSTNKSRCNYAYVWSMKSKQWGMMQSNIANSVNAYPDALAVTDNGCLVNFSDESDDTYKNIVISRPIKLDAFDIHKSVDTIIQRGVFHKGHVKSVLFASNDLYNWIPVWSSADHYLRGFRGTPYKYLRIALLAELTKGEGITGCSVQFAPRLNNQPR